MVFAQGNSPAKTRTVKSLKPGQTAKGRQPSGTRQVTRGRQTGRGRNGQYGGGDEGKNAGKGSQFYLNFTGFPFPLGPIFKRPTVRTEVRIWDIL